MKILSLIPALVALACGIQPPPRPVGVPTEAVWAGGSDGGAWIGCKWQTNEPTTSYSCTTYSDSNGRIWAEGQFVLARSAQPSNASKRRFVAVVDPFSGQLSYDGYDGRIIYLSTGKLLVPEGWIDHPGSNGHGHRVRYSLGEEKEEIEY